MSTSCAVRSQTDGKWVKDPDVEFDSDEDMPPSPPADVRPYVVRTQPVAAEADVVGSTLDAPVVEPGSAEEEEEEAS
jgi:hypothetical protein